jgi:outer membrane immunogenic protein
MRLKLTAVLLATAFTATPAFAQDPAPSMGGFRIEAIGGYDSARIEDNEDGGIVYGVGVGYDFQIGRAVLGIEGEATESTNQGCASDVFLIGDSVCAEAGRELYVGGRAGVIVGRNILLYAKAGYTNARFNIDYDDGTVAGTNNFSFSQNLDGVRVGAGAQFGIGRNAYFRAEGRYSNYEQGSDRGQVTGAFGFRF